MQCEFSTFIPQRMQPEASPSLWDDNGFSRALFTLSLISLLRCLSHWILSPAVSLQYFPVDCSVPFNFLGLKFIHAAKSLQQCPTLCDPMDSSPSGSPHSWDSPGKNTGGGYYFLLQCMKVKSESEVVQSCPTFRNPMDCSLPGSSILHGIFHARLLEQSIVHSPILIFSFSAVVTFEDRLCSLLAPRKGFSSLSLFLVFSGKPGSL